MSNIKKDIAFTVMIKFILLFLLWYVCFHQPKPTVNLGEHFFQFSSNPTKIIPIKNSKDLIAR